MPSVFRGRAERLRSLLWLLLFLGVVSTSIAGCDEFRPWCDHCHPPPAYRYSLPTAPESLITNLQLSYRNREIERYAELLAPEFLFQLEPANANEIGTQFLTRDQDSTGTRALLTTTQVSDIHINLIYGNRDSSVNVSPPVDSLKVRIITTDLQINEADTLIWVVNNQQDLFFRRGKEERGEDPSRWFIYEWDELPALSSPGGRVELTTWAKLKTQYFD